MTDSLPPVQPVNLMLPANEPERLAALHRYQILDTPAEAAFDRLTALAARLFKTPTVLISLVDESRAWFKSSIGFGASEVRRDDTMCNFAVLSNEPLIVPDTRLDDRFVCNPFVQCEPGMRFYAGAPLIDRDGFNLGTLCLLDGVPHDPLTAEEEATLVDLAAMVVDELELRLAARQIASVDAALVEITQGVSRVTGGAFFDELVRHFSKVLGVNYVYVGLVEGTEPKMMRTIAACDHGNIVENLEYRLKDTPCWEALNQHKICCYPRNVQAQFPNAPLLKPLAVESYIAIPFYGSDDNVLGLLGVMDGKPLANVHLAESLLTIFASRIATELERQQYELMLVEQTRLLEAVSTGQPLEECLSALCRSIAKLSPQTRACVLLTDDRRTKFPRAITPDFPPSLSQGLKDAPINELMIGTCGTAVYGGEPVTCTDIANDDLWSQSWRDLCIAHGILACHSVPIMGTDNLPLGSVMLCFDEARLPTAWEYRLGEFGTKIANITIDRYRSIEKLSESEERLNLALTAADMMTWDADLSTGQIVLSAQKLEVLGYDPATVDALTAEMCLSCIHPEDLAEVTQKWETARRERSLYCMEHRFMRFDTGAVVWVSATGQFLNNQAGEAMRFVGVMSDITLRKQAEIDLVENEQRLKAILDAIPHAVWVLGADGEFRFSNQQWLNYYGMSFSEATALRWSQVDPARFAAIEQQWKLSMQTGVPYEAEFCWHFGEESDRWYLCRAEPIRDQSGQIVEWVGTNTDITQLKQVEAALQESQQFVQKVAETMPGMLYVYDLVEQRNIYSNRHSLELLGYTSEQLEELGTDITPSLVHPDDLPRAMAYQAQFDTALPGEALEIEYRVRQANGEWCWLLSRSTVFNTTSAGTTQQILGVAINITDRKQAEAALQESQQFSQKITETIPGMVYVYDLIEQRIIYSNRNSIELLGYTPEQFQEIGSDIVSTVIHPDDLASVMTHLAGFDPVQGENVRELEYRAQHANGQWRWLLSRSTVFNRTLAGTTHQILGTSIDITERKLAEAAIQEARAKLNYLLEAAEFGDWDLNLADGTAFRSLKHDQIFGYESLLDQWTYDMFIDHVLPEYRAEVDRQYQYAMDNNEPWDFECRIRRADNQVRWIWASGYVYRNAQGLATRMLGLVADITARKTTELALAERNQELSSFAHTVSHDLKAPLRAVSNLSVWIEEDLEGQLPPDTQQQFQLLRTRVKRMESMIDSLLLYARAGQQEVQVETFKLSELLSEIIDSLAPPEGFSIDIQLPLPTLTTKRVFLSQVFANLIGNAIKHHNSVTGHLQISAIKHPTYHEFIIQDDGPGIAPEYHEKVFDIFQTLEVNDNSDSTGIGLAIVKKIVERERGTIRLESSLGQGTTFYLTWPKSPQ